MLISGSAARQQKRSPGASFEHRFHHSGVAQLADFNHGDGRGVPCSMAPVARARATPRPLRPVPGAGTLTIRYIPMQMDNATCFCTCPWAGNFMPDGGSEWGCSGECCGCGSHESTAADWPQAEPTHEAESLTVAWHRYHTRW